MADDVIIGRIAVKVTPDTSDFRSDARRQLEEIEKSLKDITIRVDLDTDGVATAAKRIKQDLDRSLRDRKIRVNLDNEASVRAAIGQVQRELDRLDEKTIPLAIDRQGLRDQLRQLTSDLDKAARLNLRVDPKSESSLNKAIAQIDAELAKQRELSVRVKTDPKSLEATRVELASRLDTVVQAKVELDNKDFARVRAEFDAFSKGLKINPTLDDAQVQSKLREIERTIEALDGKRAELAVALSDRDKRQVERDINDLQHKLDNLKGEIELDIANGSKLKAQASLLVLARDRTVKLIPEISQTAAARVSATLAAFSGARVARELLDGLWDAVKNLDKAAPLIGSLALAVANLGSVGIASASSLASLAASLASIAPAALALPGILGGVTVALLATIVAFSDFKNRIPEVTQVWDGLKQTIRDNFWDAAEKPIRHLIDGLLPEFSAGMAKVSGQLGEFFGALATGLGNSLQGDLAGMFDDLSRSIDIASRSAGDIANIIKVLGQTGAGYLPRLAGWFDTVTHNLSTFLTTAAQGGTTSQLNQWIDTAITALTDFGHVIVSVGSILYGLAKAADAAGGSTLATLADTLKRVAATVNSAGFQQSLIGVFIAAHTAIDNLVNQAGPALQRFFTAFAQTLQTVLPMAGQALGTLLASLADALTQPQFQQGLTDLLTGVASAAQSLAPALAPLGTALGAIGSLFGVFLTVLAPNIAAILTALAGAVQLLAPALAPVVTLLGHGLAAAINLVAPLLTGLAQTITSFTSGGALGGLAGFGQQMIAAWQPLVPLLGGTLKGLLAGLIPIFQSLLQAGQQIGPALGQALQPLLGALGPALAQLGDAVGTLVGALAPLVAQILPPLGQILGGLVALIGQVVSALAPLVATVIQIVTAVVGPLVQALGPIIAQYLPQLGTAFQQVATAIQPLLNMIKTIIDWLVPVLLPAITFIAKALLDDLIVAINTVVDVITAAVKIIQGVWDVFAGIFTGDWGRVWNGLKEIVGGVWDAIVALLKGAWQIIANLFTTLLAELKTAWNTTWNAIVSVASTVWNWLTSTWKSITSSITSACTTAWNAIKSAFTDLGSSLRSTASSMWTAMKSTFTTGVNTAVAVVNGMPGKAVAALGDLGSVLLNAGRALIQGFIDGIKAKFGEVKSLLGSLTSMLPDWKGPAVRDKTLLTSAGQLVMDSFITGLESRYAAVRQSLSGLTADISAMVVNPPQVRALDSSGLAARVSAGLATGTTVTQKILNYYAAPGASIDSEEDLFAATGRARMVGW